MQYNHVIFHGDSLNRHLRQAIYMSMRGDYIRSPNIKASQCICDGLFSGNKECRIFEDYFDETIQVSKIKGLGLCPDTSFILGKRTTAPFITRKTGKPDPGGYVDWDSVKCADSSYRGILLVVQGGLHFFMNATDTWDTLVRPMISHQKFEECLIWGKVRLVWLNMHTTSPSLDKYYPVQSRENALIFNNEIREFFISSGLIVGRDVIVVDWMNMTAGAQTSDGLHSLSDVNLAKAAQILYLVEHWPFPDPYSSLLPH